MSKDSVYNIITISSGNKNDNSLSKLHSKLKEALQTDNVKLTNNMTVQKNNYAVIFKSNNNFSSAISISQPDDASNKKIQAVKSAETEKPTNTNPAEKNNHKIAFLFTGQGSQYSGMGKSLYTSNTTFKESIDKCAAILDKSEYFDKSLIAILWGDDSKLINETKYTQPAIFSFEYALYQYILAHGLKPDAILGHSVGEYVAATIAGVMSLEDGLNIIANRASLMQALPRDGSMMMIPSDKNTVQTIIDKYAGKISIAGYNAPSSIVVSGSNKEINEMAAEFEAKGIDPIPLVVSHAFHSHLLDPMLDSLKQAFTNVTLYGPNVCLISNLTGAPIKDNEMCEIDYWIKHTRGTVQFSPSIEYLLENEYKTLLEIGPHPVLTGLATQIVNAWPNKDSNNMPMVISTCDRKKDNLETITSCFDALKRSGYELSEIK